MGNARSPARRGVPFAPAPRVSRVTTDATITAGALLAARLLWRAWARTRTPAGRLPKGTRIT